ncbi:MAG: HNH endonuclease [Myxococcales bacterium]|nr:HNH endonuclease [Myxococcales bacterium]
MLPTAEGGPTTGSNLLLACVSCSLKKGARYSLTPDDPTVARE